MQGTTRRTNKLFWMRFIARSLVVEMHVPDITSHVNKPKWLQNWHYCKRLIYLSQYFSLYHNCVQSTSGLELTLCPWRRLVVLVEILPQINKPWDVVSALQAAWFIYTGSSHHGFVRQAFFKEISIAWSKLLIIHHKFDSVWKEVIYLSLAFLYFFFNLIYCHDWLLLTCAKASKNLELTLTREFNRAITSYREITKYDCTAYL